MDFQGIKNDKIEAVFNICAEGVSVSRLEIAENTGISIVTVGKIIDRLVEAGVLCQQAPHRDSVGRRTRLIKPKSDWRIAVYALDEDEFSLHLMDLSLREKGVFNYKPESRVMISDELARFYEESKHFIAANSKPAKYLGTGILVPGGYNEATGTANLSLGSDRLMCSVCAPEYCDALPGKNIILSDNKITTLKYLSSSNKQGTSILAFFINSTLECSYIRAGDTVDRFHIGACGALPFFSGISIDEKLNQNASPETQADIIAHMIVTLIVCSAPEMLVLTGARYSRMDIFTDLIKQKVLYICKSSGIPTPDVVLNAKRHSPVVGISSEIREIWFSKEILENH